MSLTGNNDYGDTRGAFIANINTDGVAQRTGKLKKGDKLISVSEVIFLIQFNLFLIFPLET